MVVPSLLGRHRLILEQIDRNDILPRKSGWIIKHPEKYKDIPEIAAALEDYRRQIKLPLATRSSTASSGSTVSRRS
jgi:hypothetical protein